MCVYGIGVVMMRLALAPASANGGGTLNACASYTHRHTPRCTRVGPTHIAMRKQCVTHGGGFPGGPRACRITPSHALRGLVVDGGHGAPRHAPSARQPLALGLSAAMFAVLQALGFVLMKLVDMLPSRFNDDSSVKASAAACACTVLAVVVVLVVVGTVEQDPEPFDAERVRTQSKILWLKR